MFVSFQDKLKDLSDPLTQKVIKLDQPNVTLNINKYSIRRLIKTYTIKK